MKILGISAFYHDSAAAIIVNGEIISAAQEERFTRIKHDSSFPLNAVKYCLKSAECELDDLDGIAFYDKPLLKFERLLETYYSYAPKGVKSFVMAMPVWLKEKLFLKKLMRDELKKIEKYDKRKIRFFFPEHHLSHAASAFYPSNFRESAILTIDGVGEWATASISKGNGKNIKVLKEMRFPHSLGLLYSSFTYFLGFKVNSGEYKVMGLAPYGNMKSDRTVDFVRKIKDVLVDIKSDGSIQLNQKYFEYPTGLKMVNDKKWGKLFGIKKRISEEDIDQSHCDLAKAIQIVTEEIVLKMAQETKQLTNSMNLCLAGGVALNCVSNGHLLESKLFENIFVQPASGDAGGAIGAALAICHLYFKEERMLDSSKMDGMKGSYLGPQYTKGDVYKMAKKFNANFKEYSNFTELCSEVADHLDEGKVIGWMQGKMEFGPRALGNRSILGDPRSAEMQKTLNLKIKYRESFRPFAPSVLAEDSQEYFELQVNSQYMQFVRNIQKEKRLVQSESMEEKSLNEKLNVKRSEIPAITHVDFSARIQTVHKESNVKFHELISCFKKKTGCALLVNTSFNVRGEPIVNSPEDAYQCFMNTEMDYLVIENFLFSKEEQVNWKNSYSSREKLIVD